GAEIPEDVCGDEEVAEAVFLLRTLDYCVGRALRRIFRKYCGYRDRKILRYDDHAAGVVVCTPQRAHETVTVFPALRSDPPVYRACDQRVSVYQRRKDHGFLL